MSASLLARDDTMFGVCEALGQDFGVNPTILRVLFGIGLFVSPVAAFAGYAGLGGLVALSRWLVPDPMPSPSRSADEPVAAEPAASAEADEEMALAA